MKFGLLIWHRWTNCQNRTQVLSTYWLLLTVFHAFYVLNHSNQNMQQQQLKPSNKWLSINSRKKFGWTLERSLREILKHFARGETFKFIKLSAKRSLLLLKETSALWRTLLTSIWKKNEHISQLKNFVQIINSRINRVTKIALKKVTKKDVPYVLSLNTIAYEKLVIQPKFQIGDFVRKSKVDLHFRKGYKQTCTNEVFEIYDIPTINLPTYSLIDSNQDPIRGKFYQLE